ncbi:hypothetical protein [Novipirellula artificiosorum]|uniref:Quinol:cytochrome C oxidoreductase n=1 Tax=Novipirellula artificiosorum TaxID=2528016 RepID=A0A5C6DPC6_9BACT|nr:hypothetical protein [Novipirellula artificiosorum]TWU38462.1 hypothetical protein Poly41_29380 [Novipirellula artificiosorum]
MSKHAPAIKPADDPAFQLPSKLSALSIPLCAGGLFALIAGWAIGNWGVDSHFSMSAYLTAFIYCLTIALGALFFVLIQHLSRAGWSVVVRRVAELIMLMLVPLAVLFIPIVVSLWTGEGTIYKWDDPAFAEHHHIPAAVWENKTLYLEPNFFAARAVIYFVIWIGLAVYFFRSSVTQDETGEKRITERMQKWSAPALILLSLSMSFAMFDWVMSLAPMWFSTMFGVYLFSGGILSAHCAIAAGTYLLQKTGAMRDEVTVEHYHDLGKYIFGFVFFWIYIAFSQYLLIWYGAIPEETIWFYHRQLGIWGVLSLVLVFFHWILPFIGTMSRHVRRRPTLVFGWSVYILVLHFVDVYWCVMPEVYEGPGGGLDAAGGVPGIASSLLSAAGMVALMLGMILTIAGQTRIAASRDPRFGESLAFENI